MASDRQEAGGTPATWQPGSGGRVLLNKLDIVNRALMERLTGEGKMREQGPFVEQPGFDALDALASFDRAGAGHGAHDSRLAGNFAGAGLGRHGGGFVRTGASILTVFPVRRLTAIEANLEGLGYGG